MNFSLDNIKLVQITNKRDDVITKENTFYFPVFKKNPNF